MIRPYDPDWVNGVLRDVANFLAANDMPDSAGAIAHALAVIRHEAGKPGAAGGGVSLSAVRAIPQAANVVTFPTASQRRR